MKYLKTCAALSLALTAMPLSARPLGADTLQYDCGTVKYQNPVSATYQINNTTGKPVKITKVLTSCGCTTANYPDSVIASGSTYNITLTYDAQTLGHFNKQAAVYTTAGSQPVVLTLTGLVTGEQYTYRGNYPYTLGILKADKDYLEFDNVNRGETPSLKLNVYNATDETLQPVLMHLPSYLHAKAVPTMLAPHHTAVFTVTLDANKVRDVGLTQTDIYLGSKLSDNVSADKQITVSTVILPQFGSSAGSAIGDVPELKLSATQLDLGKFGKKKKLKGTITLTNVGKADLTIKRLQMFTSGLEVTLNKTTIHSGEQARMKITALAESLRKVRTTPRILMITNDEQNASVTIQVNTAF